MRVHDGICAGCGRDELLNDDELCPACYAHGEYDRCCGDALFDADELGLDPEQDDTRLYP